MDAASAGGGPVKAVSATKRDLDELRAENARLVALLVSHGIDWRAPEPSTPTQPPSMLTTEEKVTLFRRLFRGRTDVVPIRWESKAGKTGYSPACANEWRAGVCEKPRIKCSDCGHRMLIPLTDQTLYDHLAGRHTAGVYPLLADDSCHFLAVDFDDADWRDDASAFAQSCRELGVPVALEISRSGNGAHAWVFFSSNVAARDARRLGTVIISHTCSRTRQLKLTSYDRLFPNQDTMPKGGFGNLIALPLQKLPRENGGSVFVDDALQPYPDQWAFLASVQPMAPHDIEPTILRATGGSHPLDVTFVTDEDQQEPWKRAVSSKQRLPGSMPSSLAVTLANLLYFDKEQLPQPLANRLIRLAAFQNPEFYKAQAMRFPVWDEPRVIGCAENFPNHIGLPRGCLDAARELLRENGIRCDLRDERFGGDPLDVSFAGTLRLDQEAAVAARDGRQPIIFMQCGPTRHTAAKPAGAPQTLEVVPRYLAARIDLAADAGIQDVFRHVAGDASRTAAIADEIANAFEQGHKVLVLTERTEHLDAIGAVLASRVRTLFTLHGRMSKKQRAALVSELDALQPDAPRVLLSTGKLIGEGFDHPPLDTLALAMPISWKGTLQQYAGRLHREHVNKTSVRIIDFVDAGHPALLRMWDRRQRGYHAMGYRIPAGPVSDNLNFDPAPDETEAGITEAGMKAGTK